MKPTYSTRYSTRYSMRDDLDMDLYVNMVRQWKLQGRTSKRPVPHRRPRPYLNEPEPETNPQRDRMNATMGIFSVFMFLMVTLVFVSLWG